MACGTPGVAFDATGPSDIVTLRETGYLARPYDPCDLAAEIGWVLEAPGRGEEIGRAAAIDCRQRFAPALAAERYEALYREMLGVGR